MTLRSAPVKPWLGTGPSRPWPRDEGRNLRKTAWTTSLFPRDERYALPIRTDVRKTERLDEGDRIRVEMTTGSPR
jgi:hypothetical protein